MRGFPRRRRSPGLSRSRLPGSGRKAASASAPVLFAGLVALAPVGCGEAKSRPSEPESRDAASPLLPPREALAFTGVTVIPMRPDAVLEERTVTVQEGRIVRIGPARSVEVPEDARVVDGEGRFLMPGLADMHVHLDREDLGAYLAAGITTVRNMWGFPGVREMGEEIAAGRLAGPRIHGVSPGLDASPPRWPYTQIVDDPAAADSVVEAQRRAGWTVLKVYQKLGRAAYDSIVAAARRRDMAWVGHTPTAVGLDRVLESGQRSVEHLGGYEVLAGTGGHRGPAAWAEAEPSRMDALAARTAEAGVWNCPTLSIQLRMGRGLPEETRARGAENRRRMVGALHAAGGGILAGTDAGIGVTEPGRSLATELRELVKAGLSPFDALVAATRAPAEFLGAGEVAGIIREGARADLLLLEANPLEDVGAVKAVAGVMADGRWHGPDRLGRLAAAAAPRAAAPDASDTLRYALFHGGEAAGIREQDRLVGRRDVAPSAERHEKARRFVAEADLLVPLSELGTDRDPARAGLAAFHRFWLDPGPETVDEVMAELEAARREACPDGGS